MVNLAPISPSPQRSMGGTVRSFPWEWQGRKVASVYETLGQGQPVLLLPAFSTVSSRTEMAGIARCLRSHFQVTALDWLGFGQSERPRLDYQPELYHHFLQDFLLFMGEQPLTVVAAGHAAGYVLKAAQDRPEAISKVALVAPTWLGPLRVMGVPQTGRDLVKQVVRTPILGQLLYFLNTTPAFLRFMYASHVFVEAEKLTPQFIAAKHEITQHPGARYAPAAFVTGGLDPVKERGEFLNLLRGLDIPLLAVMAEQAPPTSHAEMEAIAELREIETVRLPGTLGIHEEYPEAVAQAILKFLLSNNPRASSR